MDKTLLASAGTTSQDWVTKLSDSQQHNEFPSKEVGQGPHEEHNRAETGRIVLVTTSTPASSPPASPRRGAESPSNANCGAHSVKSSASDGSASTGHSGTFHVLNFRLSPSVALHSIETSALQSLIFSLQFLFQRPMMFAEVEMTP
jgi:hypothetical protein